MNEMELAGAFANLVGLVCNFAQARASDRGATRQEFIEWLQYHRHEELARQIAESRGLQQEIDLLLRRNHDELLAAVKSANEMISAVIARIDVFSGIAKAAVANGNLSDQAMFFLHQLANSGHQQLILLDGRDNLIFENGEGAGYIGEEKRFMWNDLETLSDFGFVSYHQNRHGHHEFELTRSGLALLQASKWSPERIGA